MPNWCSNTLTLSHSNPNEIDRAVLAFSQGRLLDEFVPVPQALRDTTAGHSARVDEQEQREILEEINQNLYQYKNWYDFCINEWGTKWDVGDVHSFDQTSPTTVNFTFDSAWAPPIRAYDAMVAQGFDVEATYWEPGVAFVGAYNNGYDNSFDYSQHTSDTVRDLIGEELDDAYGISESMVDWENQ